MQRWSPEVIRYLHTAADRSRYYTDLARELGAFLYPEDRVCDAGCRPGSAEPGPSALLRTRHRHRPLPGGHRRPDRPGP